MNILVINLTRFGDLLQTAAAIRSLARESGKGKHRIGVVCLENFRAGAALLADVTDIYPMPAAHIMALFDGGRMPGGGKAGNAEWLRGLAGLHAWVEDIREQCKPDRVCNLSPTTPASLLGRLLAQNASYSGFTLDALGFSETSSLWASFIQGASASRLTSPFNIADLFRKVASPASTVSSASLLPVPEAAVAAMRHNLTTAAPEPPAGFIALQLGASAAIRQWPVAFFAQTGDALWRARRFLPVLLGTKNEIPLAEEYASLAGEPFISLMGRTDITELASALTVSSLCISNDTGTLHLASGLGVPVLGLYLATAQPWDTGPYASGNCSLEPDLPCHPCEFGTSCPNAYACHTAITPAAVLALAAAKIREGTWDAANFAAPSGSRIWESTRDAHGFADLRSLSGHEKTGRTQWMRLQRHLYRQFFDKIPGQPFLPSSPETPFILDATLRTTLARICDDAVALFDALTQQAAMLKQRPLPLIRERFAKTWQRIAALLRSDPNLAAIAFSWQTEAMRQSDLDRALPLIRQYRDFFTAFRSFLS